MSFVKRTFSQDSDFPQTFSWASSPETMMGHRVYSQSFSSDILRFDNFELMPLIKPAIIAALDQTTLAVEFDHSCLEGLDDQLLKFPTDAYAAICWDAAVLDEPAASSLTRSPPTTGLQNDFCLSDESEDSDTDESRTFDEDSMAIEGYGMAVNSCLSHSTTVNTTEHFITSFKSNEKFILEPQLTHIDPAESIGLFPIPHQNQKVKTTGVTALRAYLPLRRKKSVV